MLTYIEGNLFLSTAQTLVNTVNTAGVMGKGIARDFKSFYPTMFAEYKRACDAGTLVMGSLLLYRTAHKWVLNFPTKRHWRQASRLSDIEQRLETFQRTYAEQGISSIAFPQLGCGQGGLDWESEVRPLMERYLGALPVDVFVHVPAAPSDAPSVSREEIADWLTAIPALMRCADFRDDVLAQATAHGSAANGLYAIDRRGASGETDDLFDLWRQLRSSGYLLPDDVPVMLGAPAEPFFEHLTRMPYVQRARVVRQPSISYDDGSIDSLFGLPEAQGVQSCRPRPSGEHWRRHRSPTRVRWHRERLRRRRHAEIIVPEELSLSALRSVEARSNPERQTLLSLLGATRNVHTYPPEMFLTDANTFHCQWSYVERATMSGNQLLFLFNPDSLTPGPFPVWITWENPNSGASTITQHSFRAAGNVNVPIPEQVRGSRVKIELYLDDSLAFSGTLDQTPAATLLR